MGCVNWVSALLGLDNSLYSSLPEALPQLLLETTTRRAALHALFAVFGYDASSLAASGPFLQLSVPLHRIPPHPASCRLSPLVPAESASRWAKAAAVRLLVVEFGDALDASRDPSSTHSVHGNDGRKTGRRGR